MRSRRGSSFPRKDSRRSTFRGGAFRFAERKETARPGKHLAAILEGLEQEEPPKMGHMKVAYSKRASGVFFVVAALTCTAPCGRHHRQHSTAFDGRRLARDNIFVASG